MKQVLYGVFFVVLMVLGSCDKVPENGDLDGLWQLMEVKEGAATRNVKAEHRYVSFQLKLFMLGSDEGPRQYFGRFQHQGGTLRFYSFTFRSDYTESSNYDQLMTDADLPAVSPWGFYSVDCVYDVELLTDETLVLSHAGTRLTYRKW